MHVPVASARTCAPVWMGWPASRPSTSASDLCAIVTAAVNEPRPGRGRRHPLARQDISVSTTEPEHTQFDTEDRGVHPLVRLSPHYYNTDEEIRRCIDAIAEIAAS